jgi:very-short-patch-repair endonuclease
VLDFYCPEARLGIEIDGGVHEALTSVQQDRDRDEFLDDGRIGVLRVRAGDVERNVDEVLARIRVVLADATRASQAPRP